MYNSKKKEGNRIFAWLLALAMILTLIPQTSTQAAATGVPTADGIYSVYGEMKHSGNISQNSMSNDAIVHNIKLTVKDGTYRLTMNFQGLTIALGNQSLHSYLKNMKYYKSGFTLENNLPKGDLEDVTVESLQKYTDGTILSDDFGTEYPDILSFDLVKEALEDGKVPLQVYVPVMDAISKGSGTQDVILILDWSKVTKVDSADDPCFSEGDIVEENPNAKKEEPTTGKKDDTTTEKKDDTTTGKKDDTTTEKKPDTTTQKKDDTTKAKTLKKGSKYTAGGNTYQALSANTVSLVKAAAKKSVSVPATVTVGGVKASVTAIGASAFTSAKKKVTSVTIGTNVTSIGRKAFAGCSKLKKITVNSTKLKSVGSKALSGIHKKAVIKVPKKQKKAYTKLFKNKGQKKTVKVK